MYFFSSFGFLFFNAVLLITSQTVHSDSVEGDMHICMLQLQHVPLHEEEEAAAVEEEQCGSAVSKNIAVEFH